MLGRRYQRCFVFELSATPSTARFKENMRKECEEEASLPSSLSNKIKSAGQVNVCKARRVRRPLCSQQARFSLVAREGEGRSLAARLQKNVENY